MTETALAISPTLKGDAVRARAEEALHAVIVSAAPSVGATTSLIVGTFPSPGHMTMTPVDQVARRLTLNTFAR